MSSDNNFTLQLQQLQQQFLCCYPIAQINWQSLLPKELNWEQQEQLITQTCAHALNKLYPLKSAYVLSFLKRLIAILESCGIEVHDQIYESYCQQLNTSAADVEERFAYKHYQIRIDSEDAVITLRESKSFVTEGTTGLCSWQASLALADYLLHNASIVEKRNILELGAGTGLCGIILKRCLNPGEVLLTDGSADCVQLMRENINFNFTQITPPKVAQLLWDDVADFEWTSYAKPQLILAADVVYNETQFAALIGAIDYVFKMCNNTNVEMLLAATVRNEQTLDKFIEKLVKLNFTYVELATLTTERNYLYWDRSVPIKILAIKRE